MVEAMEIKKGFKKTEVGIIPTDWNEKQIGEVTSGTQAPSLQKAIGMGYVETTFAKEGAEISIKIRDKYLKARVVKIPFFKK